MCNFIDPIRYYIVKTWFILNLSNCCIREISFLKKCKSLRFTFAVSHANQQVYYNNREISFLYSCGNVKSYTEKIFKLKRLQRGIERTGWPIVRLRLHASGPLTQTSKRECSNVLIDHFWTCKLKKITWNELFKWFIGNNLYLSELTEITGRWLILSLVQKLLI